MILSRPLTAGAAVLALATLAACEKKPTPPEPRETAPAASRPVAVASPPASPTDAPPIPTDLRAARLNSRDCATVALFYSDALFTSQYQQAARAWDKYNGVDGAMLAKRFGNMEGVKLDIGEVAEEGAAGSLYCTVQVTLRHDSTAQPGTLTLRRVNDVPGATIDQLRWQIVQSTLGENGKPASRATIG